MMMSNVYYVEQIVEKNNTILKVHFVVISIFN